MPKANAKIVVFNGAEGHDADIVRENTGTFEVVIINTSRSPGEYVYSSTDGANRKTDNVPPIGYLELKGVTFMQANCGTRGPWAGAAIVE